jgi:LPS-assembly protein
MLKLASWIFSLLFCLPLVGQEAPVLPDSKPLPAVDMITPVPAPVIPFAGADSVSIPKELKINNKGGPITWDAISGIGHFGGPVKVNGDNGLEVFANSATLDTKEKKITLEGDVSVYQGNLLQRGARAIYFYERKFLDSTGLRASMDPILLEAGKFTADTVDGKQVLVGENAGITTDDEENPNFWIRAKKTTIYPGDKIVFNYLKLYAGGTPIFWLPYLSQPLNKELGYHVLPGAKSSWGPYFLNTYGVMLGGKFDPKTGEREDAWLLSQWHVDILTKRGLGTGVNLKDPKSDNTKEISGFGAYYLYDLAPSTRRSGVPRGGVDPNRYELELKHRQVLNIPDQADWRFDTNITKLSDNYYLQDFQQQIYNTNPAPDNTLGVYRRDDASLFSVYMRLRLNDFYRTDTRLPEITYDSARAPILGLPILHEGSTSLGIIGEQASPADSLILQPLLTMAASDPNTLPLLNQLTGYERQLAEKLVALPLTDYRARDAIRAQLIDSNYTRFNTYQEFSMPFKVGNFLNLTPDAGIGYTRYMAANGPITNTDKTYIHVGAEASVKFSKDLGDYQNSDLGIDGLMHVFQPYATWSLVSTNNYDPLDPMVDHLTPTTRPQPLYPTRFTAMDQLQSWDIVRIGTRNRLLTKRDNQSYEWLYLDTYLDAFLNDPEGKRNFSNLYNDITWKPMPWLGLDLSTQVPIVSNVGGFSEIDSRIRYQATENIQFSLGYRLLSGNPEIENSDHIDLQVYTRLNENWGVGMSHSIELDDHTLELEEYTIHRDLGNWVAAMGLSRQDNRVQKEYGVLFSLTLKEFPSGALPLQVKTPE